MHDLMGSNNNGPTEHAVTATGVALLRWSLVAILIWFGAFKFTDAEARAIEPLLRHSPFMFWMYTLGSVRVVSMILGTAELTVAVLIALRAYSPRASAIGSIGAIGIFLATLSFLATTPGLWTWVDGFPVPAGDGAFIVKDVFLLGAAVLTAGEALEARRAAGWAGMADARLFRRTGHVPGDQCVC